MTNFIARLTALAGAGTAATLAEEFGGKTVYVGKPELPQEAPIGWGCNDAKAACSYLPLLHDFLQNAIEDAVRNELTMLMAGAVTCRPEDQHEWLATAQQVLALRLLALAWHASQKTTLTQPAQPESAA